MFQKQLELNYQTKFTGHKNLHVHIYMHPKAEK